MRVQIKLYATLRQYAPKENEIGDAFTIEIENPSIQGLIDYFGFNKSDAKIIMVNGIRVDRLDFKLSENDLVVIFPPVGGG